MRYKRPSDFDFGILFGIIAGFTIAVLVGWIVEAALYDGHWIRDYQTIIGAILTVIVAFLTILAIITQVVQADEIRREQLTRESNAARPLLSFVLVELSKYAKDCAGLIAIILNKSQETDFNKVKLPDELPEIPRVPDEIFEGIRSNLIVGNDDAVKALSGLLVLVQVQSSRLAHFLSKERASNYAVAKEVRAHLIDAIELHARCMNLFVYARGEEDFPISVVRKGDMFSSAGLLFILQSQSPLVMELLEKYPD